MAKTVKYVDEVTGEVIELPAELEHMPTRNINDRTDAAKEAGIRNLQKASEAIAGSTQSDEHKSKRVKSRKQGKTAWKITTENQKKMQEGAKKKGRWNKGKRDPKSWETKICPIDGVEFTSPRRQNKQTCSRSCANKLKWQRGQLNADIARKNLKTTPTHKKK